MGWLGTRRVPCVICRAASGQSVAIRPAPLAPIASKSGFTTFSDSSKYSRLKPHVPSTAEHFSMTVTSAPGMAPSTSADLRPMFCARRWHGTWYAIGPGGRVKFVRSEEHTSELQSRPHLVCRLLLEKKKKKKKLYRNMRVSVKKASSG